MVVPRLPATSSSMLDVLERVLDRGIVIDAWVGVSLAGIRVLEVDTRIVVASLETHLPESSPRPPAPEPSPALLRRRRRRRVEPQPTSRLRCETGCTFEWARAARPPATMACPYRRRVRCRLVAA